MTARAAPAPLAEPRLIKSDPSSPALRVAGRDSLVVKAGVRFAGRLFAEETLVDISEGLIPGSDYCVVAFEDDVPRAWRGLPIGDDVIGGFHYAPGGNAPARDGGDEIPAINPCSLWDLTHRPACPDPRGMTFVAGAATPFWCDIYLTTAEPALDGKRLGLTIADGDDRPRDADGERYPRFDYETARAVLAAQGKTLLSHDEFIAAAFGVKEGSSAPRDPKVTRLDAARTSACGGMQMTGNLWVWGYADPTDPRASLFGGSWVDGADAGSRTAYVGYWPGHSDDDVGARGRSDPLKPV